MKLEIIGSIETPRGEGKVKRCCKGPLMHIMGFYEHILMDHKS